jgi:hypothetical protein
MERILTVVVTVASIALGVNSTLYAVERKIGAERETNCWKYESTCPPMPPCWLV